MFLPPTITRNFEVNFQGTITTAVLLFTHCRTGPTLSFKMRDTCKSRGCIIHFYKTNLLNEQLLTGENTAIVCQNDVIL